MSDVELAALRKDIRRRGVRVPLQILPNGIVVCGHQRLRAAQLEGLTEVPVVVRTDLATADDDLVIEELMQDNLHRRHLTQIEKAAVFQETKRIVLSRRLQIDGELRDHVAAMLGFQLSGRTLDRLARFLVLPRPIRRALGNKIITEAVATEILRRPTQVQAQIAEEFAAGRSAKQIYKRFGLGVRASRDPQAVLDLLTKRLRKDIPVLRGSVEHVRCSDVALLKQATQILTSVLRNSQNNSATTREAFPALPANVAIRPARHAESAANLSGD